MSDVKAKRLIIGAIVAIYAGFVLVSFAKHFSEKDSHAVEIDGNDYPGHSSFAQSSIINMKAYAFPEGHPCNDPNEGDKADLCQQWRMAEAAEQLTGLTWKQIIITGVEVILLVAVLAYTARATNTAVNANRQSRETMVVENRPWLLLDSLDPASDLQWRGDYCDFSYRVVFKNFGKTPARYVNIWGYEMILGPEEVSTIIYQILSKRPPSFVMVGDTVAQDKPYEKIRHVGFSKSNVPNEEYGRLVIIVRVQYSTIFDNEVRESRYVVSLVRKKDGGKVSVTAGEAFVPLSELVLEPYPFCEEHIT